MKKNGRLIFFEYQKNFRKQSRLGITVTKRFGNAWQRNRIKRLIRESFRLNRHDLPDHYDLFIKPKYSAINTDFKAIMDDFEQFLKHLSTDSLVNF